MADLPLSPKQLSAILDHPDARTAICHGAVRSGKTIATCLRFMAALAEAPPIGHVVIVGKTLQTIEANIIEPMMSPGVFGPLAEHVRHTNGASTARILGRDVRLVGANDARSEEKIRGMTACLALVDEATLVPQPFWQQLGARLSVPGAKLIATTNPGGPRHWLKTEWLDRADELDLAAWHFTLDDNPGLDPAYVANLKAENVGVFYQRNIEGRWVAAEGAVYPMWDEARHVIAWPDLPQLVRLVAGVDYGTTNPTDAVILGQSLDGRWWAVDEWRSPKVGLDDATQALALSEWLAAPHTPQDVQPPMSAVRIDPAAASFKAALRNRGVRVADADNGVLEGIKAVGSALSTGVLSVSDRCRWLLTEIPGYMWDTRATEHGDDAPIKSDDHAVDALRYAYIAATKGHSRQANLG